MRITPWMLTMTTFVMVGAIGVLYLFKPPQRIPSGPVPPGASYVHARAYQAPINVSPVVGLEAPPDDPVVSGHGGGVADVDSGTQSDTTERPYTPEAPTGTEIVQVPPAGSNPDGGVEAAEPPEAIDPMFDGQPTDEPRFVTQQFRGASRIDVTFRDGDRVIVPRVSVGLETRTNQ